MSADDIVTRLRICESEYGVGDTVREAADEIERLRADRDRWIKWGTHVFVCPNKGLNPCDECVSPSTRDAINRYDRGRA